MIRNGIKFSDYPLRVTKLAYEHLIEHLCRYGYYIGDMLHPVYKDYCAQKLIDKCNSLSEKHNGEDHWEYNDKLTLKNDCGYEGK